MSHWQSKTKIDASDTLFSKLVRRRDKNCQVCGRLGIIDVLECSHFWGRRFEGTRFDFDNCDALCRSCHAKFETEKGEGRAYWNWKLQRLGPSRFDALNLKAHTYCKKDRKMVLIVLKSIMKDYERQEKVIGGRA